MNPVKILQFFESRKRRGEPMVLATVFETRGSTYSKIGAHMLIDGNGIFQGMLSGGCLEGDLAMRARVVIESGNTQSVTYDLGRDDDEIWGLGVGCDGMMKVFLQPILQDSGYQPFTTVSEVLQGASAKVVATVIESTSPEAPVGATVLVAAEESSVTGAKSDHVTNIVAAAQLALSSKTSQTLHVNIAGAQVLVLLAYVAMPPRLLVLGGGPDAEPVVRFAAELGWRCTIVDHRPAYIDNGDFSSAVEKFQIVVDELSKRVDLAQFDLALVMSHHLDSDRSYLRQLAATDIGYIGLLGPLNRRERLLAELGDDAARLRERVKGPAGLDIGGRGPGPIALSIITEMQIELQRNATHGAI